MTRAILGIDPGTLHLGVGCIRSAGNQLRLIHVEVFDAPQKDPFYNRLSFLYDSLQRLLDKLLPNEVALEDIFFAKNAKSAFKLGIARGMVLTACLERKIPVFEYAPTQVKTAVTGYGRADKQQVKKMTQLVLGTEVSLKFDATDALAVAICHANQNPLLRNTGRNA